jgi:hypothetical protein
MKPETGILTGKPWAFAKGWEDFLQFGVAFNPFRSDDPQYEQWVSGWEARQKKEIDGENAVYEVPVVEDEEDLW